METLDVSNDTASRCALRPEQLSPTIKQCAEAAAQTAALPQTGPRCFLRACFPLQVRRDLWGVCWDAARQTRHSSTCSTGSRDPPKLLESSTRLSCASGKKMHAELPQTCRCFKGKYSCEVTNGSVRQIESFLPWILRSTTSAE